MKHSRSTDDFHQLNHKEEPTLDGLVESTDGEYYRTDIEKCQNIFGADTTLVILDDDAFSLQSTSQKGNFPSIKMKKGTFIEK